MEAAPFGEGFDDGEVDEFIDKRTRHRTLFVVHFAVGGETGRGRSHEVHRTALAKGVPVFGRELPP